MEKLKIGAVEHDNRSKLWCGPAVISSVTGVGTRVITEELRVVRRRRLGDRRHRIAGVTNRELVDVLLEHGVIPEVFSDYVIDPRPPTLAQWLRINPEQARRDPILIRLTGHFIVVQGRRFVDNSNPIPTWLKDAPRRARVLSAWRLVPTSRFATVEDFRRSYAPTNERVPGMVPQAAGARADV